MRQDHLLCRRAGGRCERVQRHRTRAPPKRRDAPPGLDQIETVVVIYAENRSFDNLYGFFPGANGLQARAAHGMVTQRDRDGTRAEGVAAGLGRAHRQGASRRR